MKKTNKGFSMVELIIVIAIMAILAGALAPALIKYINKSRISTDIQTANTIATAVQTALANETGYDCASTYDKASTDLSTIWGAGDDFATTVKDTVGGSKCPTIKAKKCIAKGSGQANSLGTEFTVYLDRAGNKVEVSTSDGTKTHMLYPTASSCLTNDSEQNCQG